MRKRGTRKAGAASRIGTARELPGGILQGTCGEQACRWRPAAALVWLNRDRSIPIRPPVYNRLFAMRSEPVMISQTRLWNACTVSAKNTLIGARRKADTMPSGDRSMAEPTEQINEGVDFKTAYEDIH